MDWSQPVTRLEDFEVAVSQISSELKSVLLEQGREERCINEDENDTQLRGCSTTSVSNTSNIPLQCEVLSFIEKNGVGCLDSFSFTRSETEPSSSEYFTGSSGAVTSTLEGKFQPYCCIGIYSDKLQLQQKILCSLSCTLDDLYSEVFCYNTTIASKLVKEVSRNFLFCFENVFYTKLETWGSNEYVRNFEDFVKLENLETLYGKDWLRDLVVKEAQDVQMGELAIRFGVPYALLHLGDCEHKLIFEDLFADIYEDCQKACKTVFLKPPKPRICGVCRIKNSVIVCHNHDLADASPYFFCSDCYERVKCDANTNVYQLHSEHPFE